MGKVKITDEIESLKTEVAKLKNRGVEIIIALGHSGLDMDKRIAREVDGIDAVVGGHSHSYLFSGESNIIRNTIRYKEAEKVIVLFNGRHDKLCISTPMLIQIICT